MTGTEIRENWTRPGEDLQIRILAEICAQLADLNAHLRDGGSAISVALCSGNDNIPVRIVPS